MPTIEQENSEYSDKIRLIIDFTNKEFNELKGEFLHKCLVQAIAGHISSYYKYELEYQMRDRIEQICKEVGSELIVQGLKRLAETK